MWTSVLGVQGTPLLQRAHLYVRCVGGGRSVCRSCGIREGGHVSCMCLAVLVPLEPALCFHPICSGKWETPGFADWLPQTPQPASILPPLMLLILRIHPSHLGRSCLRVSPSSPGFSLFRDKSAVPSRAPSP